MDIGVAHPQNELRGDPAAVRTCGRAVEDLGCHVSMVTMGLGLDSVDAHIDYLAALANVLVLS